MITAAAEPSTPEMICLTVNAENSAPTASEVTSPSSSTLAGTCRSTEPASRISPTYASG